MKLDFTACEVDGFLCHEFKFEGRDAKVVLPKNPDPAGRWLLKTEYFGAFPAFQNEMLERGYHVAYVANITRWMKPDDIDVKERFAAYLEAEYGLNPKCVPVGMSCGGLHAVYFAAKYPERIAAMYLDAGEDGLERAASFVLPYLKEEVARIEKQGRGHDYKTVLQQFIQQDSSAKLEYVTVGETGPDHAKTFEVEARMGSNIIGRGKGKTKREAETEAAFEALTLFGEIKES